MVTAIVDKKHVVANRWDIIQKAILSLEHAACKTFGNQELQDFADQLMALGAVSNMPNASGTITLDLSYIRNPGDMIIVYEKHTGLRVAMLPVKPTAMGGFISSMGIVAGSGVYPTHPSLPSLGNNPPYHSYSIPNSRALPANPDSLKKAIGVDEAEPDKPKWKFREFL